MVEYYEDLFEEDPHAQLESMRGDDGEIVLDDTGDPLIDKWERELAMGLEPDLEEGLGEQAKEALKKERNKAKNVREVSAEALINDDYSNRTSARDDAKYLSKFVAVGSKEEEALLRASALGRSKGKAQDPHILGGALKRRGR